MFFFFVAQVTTLLESIFNRFIVFFYWNSTWIYESGKTRHTAFQDSPALAHNIAVSELMWVKISNPPFNLGGGFIFFSFSPCFTPFYGEMIHVVQYFSNVRSGRSTPIISI